MSTQEIKNYGQSGKISIKARLAAYIHQKTNWDIAEREGFVFYMSV